MNKKEPESGPTIFVIGFCIGILVMWFIERGLMMKEFNERQAVRREFNQRQAERQAVRAEVFKEEAAKEEVAKEVEVTEETKPEPIPTAVTLPTDTVQPRSIRSASDEIARRVIGNRGAGHLYGAEFRAAVYLYWPAAKREDWLKLLAQCKVESGLKTDAKSPAGAVGLCQFMPGTWRDWLKVNHGLSKDRRDAVSNINAAAQYMAQMFKFWRAPRSWECREELAQASYNWGAGNVHRQQMRYGGRCLADFGQDLPKETKDYTKRIRAAFEKLTKL